MRGGKEAETGPVSRDHTVMSINTKGKGIIVVDKDPLKISENTPNLCARKIFMAAYRLDWRE